MSRHVFRLWLSLFCRSFQVGFIQTSSGDFMASTLHSFASLSLPLSLFPPCLYYTHKHCTVYQETLLYDVSSWTCCFSGEQSFANPHPSHLKERRCWKTWWPLMSSWETSTLITALQVFSSQLLNHQT